MKRIVLLSLIALAGIFYSFIYTNDNARDGGDIIRLMYEKHSDNWYPHLTFKQDMFRYRDDSLIRNEVWLVAYSAPGKLNIRYKDFDSGRGWLVVNDTLYSFNHNRLIGKRPRLHELMILGLDACIVPPEKTIPKVIDMGFDISILSKTTINGKSVYQIGDPEKQCFWIHKESLLFYGIRKVGDMGTREMFFENYKPFYQKPVATQIQYYQDQNLFLFEKYFDIRLPSNLSEDLFNPELFTEVRW